MCSSFLVKQKTCQPLHWPISFSPALVTLPTQYYINHLNTALKGWQANAAVLPELRIQNRTTSSRPLQATQ